MPSGGVVFDLFLFCFSFIAPELYIGFCLSRDARKKDHDGLFFF